MRKTIAALVLVAAAAVGCSAPQEDSLEAALIMTWAGHTWDNTDEDLPCEPEAIYEVYPLDRSMPTTGVFIGVIGECSETSIGVYFPVSPQDPSYPLEAGIFQP